LRVTPVNLPFLALLVVSVLATQTSSKSEARWWWFATCGGPMMTVEVKVHRTVIKKVSVPLCRVPQAPNNRRPNAEQINFSFRPQRALVFTGYRDESDRVLARQVVECSLWQAGADPDAVLIGVSFSTSNRILMNTIHIAHPNRRDQSTITRDLTVTTYPTAR
jgi:hypothetical protein